MNVMDLARPEIRALKPYASARAQAGDTGILLNANENPWPPAGDGRLRLNRYPDPQPAELVRRLASYYGVAPEQILVTRGSDEGIDLLVRAFCQPGRDHVIVCPPTFGLYAISARINGATVAEVPLEPDTFGLDTRAMANTAPCKLTFACSPNNPTGNAMDRQAVRELAARGGLMVVDEAYQEFCDQESMITELGTMKNLVVLRTLSKAFALAGCRVGAVIAHAEIIALLKRILPPYPLPTPSIMAAIEALGDQGIARMRDQVRILRAEKQRLCLALNECPAITRLWPGQANFVLVKVRGAADFVTAAAAAGIRLRDQSWQHGLDDCVRITVGTPEENNALLEFISS